jgi:predicted nucleic acid-binding protein
LISADTSSLIAHFSREPAHDAEKVELALKSESLILAPIVLTELLSSLRNADQLKDFLADVPIFEILPGYWWRAGESRRRIIRLGLKARTADTLVAQCCIDADVPLIAHDRDFRHFEKHCGLKLA